MLDPGIAPLVRELNKAGLKTLYSCAGHDDRPEVWDRYVVIKLTDKVKVFVEDGTLTIYWHE